MTDTAPEGEDVTDLGLPTDDAIDDDLLAQVGDILATRETSSLSPVADPATDDASIGDSDAPLDPPPPSAVGGEGGELAPSGDAPDTAAPDEYAETYDLLGRTYTHEQLIGLLSLEDWASSLSPEQANAAIQAVQGNTVYTPPPAAPAPAPADPLAELDEYDLDPRVRDIIRGQQAQLDAIASTTQSVAATTEQQRLAQYEVAANRAQDRFAEKYDIPPTQAAQIASLAATSLNGEQYLTIADLDQRFDTMLEHASWLDPAFRDAQLTSKIEAAAAQAATQAVNSRRKANASAVTSSSGSVPRAGTAPSPKDMSREDITAAMAEEIRQFQNQSG